MRRLSGAKFSALRIEHPPIMELLFQKKAVIVDHIEEQNVWPAPWLGKADDTPNFGPTSLPVTY